MRKRTNATLAFLALGTALVAALLTWVIYESALYARQALQVRFADIHAMLSGQDPDEPFADGQLSESEIRARDSVVIPIRSAASELQWTLLAQARVSVSTQDGADTYRPDYPAALRQSSQHVVRIRGFMFPLNAGLKQTRFLLSPYPSSCPYCLPAGANELIEVTPDAPVRFSYDSIVISGVFELVAPDSDFRDGMFYHMRKAALVD